MSTDTKPPAIARIWRGRTRPEMADAYEAYSYEAGIKPLIEKAMGVQTLREDRAHETEFMTISYWESIEAMSAFAGDDPSRIHHLDRDPEFLIELPNDVQILRLLTSHGITGRAEIWGKPGIPRTQRSGFRGSRHTAARQLLPT